MQTDLRLFGPAHLAIVASVPASAAVLSWITSRHPGSAKAMRFGLAVAVAAAALSWYAYRFAAEHVQLPQGMPLELCDFSFGLTVFALLTLRRRAFDLAYYWGVGGAGMAMLTPSITTPLGSFPAVVFFVRHGTVIVSILYLLWTRQARPSRNSWWFALLVLNACAVLVGIVDYLTGRNYMYLRAKPPTVSLFDLLGPWPWYLLASEFIAAVIFLLMYWPFRSAAGNRGHRRRSIAA